MAALLILGASPQVTTRGFRAASGGRHRGPARGPAAAGGDMLKQPTDSTDRAGVVPAAAFLAGLETDPHALDAWGLSKPVAPAARPDKAGRVVRWLPIGRPPAERPAALLRHPGVYTGDRFIRVSADLSRGKAWENGIPPASPAQVDEDRTALGSSVLRGLGTDELPTMGRLVMISSVTDSPGSYALQGLPLHGGYGPGPGRTPEDTSATADAYRGTRAQRRLVPIGAILAAYARVGVGTRNGRIGRTGIWRAWRVPPADAPYLELELEDPRLARGWTADEMTPQEEIARLLDTDIEAAFAARLSRLRAGDVPRYPRGPAAEAAAAAFSRQLETWRWARDAREPTAGGRDRRTRRSKGRQRRRG